MKNKISHVWLDEGNIVDANFFNTITDSSSNPNLTTISTPYDPSKFRAEYLYEWVTYNSIRTEKELMNAVLRGLSIDEIMEYIPCNIGRNYIEKKYKLYTSDAWRILYA